MKKIALLLIVAMLLSAVLAVIPASAADTQSADILILEEIDNSRHGGLGFPGGDRDSIQNIALLVADGADHFGAAGFQTAVILHGSLAPLNMYYRGNAAARGLQRR